MTKISFVFESLNVFEYFTKELLKCISKGKNTKSIIKIKKQKKTINLLPKESNKNYKYEALIKKKETLKVLYKNTSDYSESNKIYKKGEDFPKYYGINLETLIKIDLFEISELKNYLLKENIRCRNYLKSNS